MRNPLARLVRAFIDRKDRRWLSAPAGCCACGTGGPYYEGTAPRVTRYLYGDLVMAGSTGTDDDGIGWSSCSAHPLAGEVPVVDYGHDVVVSFAQAETDFTWALT